MQLKPHSLKALLNNSAELKHLTVTAGQMQQLHAQVCRQLPASLSAHCLGVQQHASALIIYMDNAASATLLHFQKNQLMSKLTTMMPSYKHLKVRVLTQPISAPVPQPVTRTLSQQVRAMLESTAAGLDEGRLSRSLRNLARSRSQQQ